MPLLPLMVCSPLAAAVLHEFAARSSEDRGITVSPAVLRERLELAVGHDGAGRLLQEIGADTSAEKIFQPDQELEFPADALASLVIGNARSARMTIDGRDVNLSKFMKSDVVRMSDATLREALR